MGALCNSNCSMGDCTVLFSGDLPQILSVITRGTRADEVNASLKRMYLWPHISELTPWLMEPGGSMPHSQGLHITKCELKTNMKIVSSIKDNGQFSTDLLQIDNDVNDYHP